MQTRHVHTYGNMYVALDWFILRAERGRDRDRPFKNGNRLEPVVCAECFLFFRSWLVVLGQHALLFHQANRRLKMRRLRQTSVGVGGFMFVSHGTRSVCLCTGARTMLSRRGLFVGGASGT